jgi:hypothetical protein
MSAADWYWLVAVVIFLSSVWLSLGSFAEVAFPLTPLLYRMNCQLQRTNYQNSVSF